MIVLAIAIMAVTVYLTGFAVTLRHFYAAWRPYTEPLSCVTELSCSPRYNGEHYPSCYSRPGSLIESTAGALATAGAAALGWPFVVLGAAILAVIRRLAGNTPELPEERAARIKRMEDEAGLNP